VTIDEDRDGLERDVEGHAFAFGWGEGSVARWPDTQRNVP
jgi:hypothetical protein